MVLVEKVVVLAKVVFKTTILARTERTSTGTGESDFRGHITSNRLP